VRKSNSVLAIDQQQRWKASDAAAPKCGSKLDPATQPVPVQEPPAGRLFFWHEIQDSGALCAVKGLFQAAVRIGLTFADTAVGGHSHVEDVTTVV